MLKKFLLNTLFPQYCLGCGRQGSIVCQDCLGLIPIAEYQYCPFCSFVNRVIDRGKCPTHQKMELDGLWSATTYQEPLVKKLIANFKYKPYLKTLAHPLAFLIIAHFALLENKAIFQTGENSYTGPGDGTNANPNHLFVPVPLTSRKKRQRGFNQAELLAQELSSAFKIPCHFNNLIKIRKTRPQTSLTRQERVANIKHAFAIKNPALVQNKKIFLVDDVFTTGATMEECARILKAANASQVWGITVAREPLNI